MQHDASGHTEASKRDWLAGLEGRRGGGRDAGMERESWGVGLMAVDAGTLELQVLPTVTVASPVATFPRALYARARATGHMFRRAPGRTGQHSGEQCSITDARMHQWTD